MPEDMFHMVRPNKNLGRQEVASLVLETFQKWILLLKERIFFFSFSMKEDISEYISPGGVSISLTNSKELIFLKYPGADSILYQCPCGISIALYGTAQMLVS